MDMNKKINIVLVLLLLIFSIGAVSAVDDLNVTVSSDNDNPILLDDSMSEKSDKLGSIEEQDEVLSANSHTINSGNYLNYFDNSGNLVSTSVNSGDTIKLDGSFSNMKFIFNKKVLVSGTSTNSMRECTVILKFGASGSSISNLNIKNTANDAYGIYLNGASNCVVSKCNINNTGAASYDIVLGNSNNNQIINNELCTYGETYGHNTRSTPSIVLTGSHYNTISNNNIECDDTNAIYLSSYNGPESNFNVIYNNTVQYNLLPTSWSYGIQIMGSNNTVDSNTIIGGYRGISSSTNGVGGNKFVNNRIINLRGADYNDKDTPTGGEYGIVGTYNSVIKNNIIINARILSTGAAISALDNSVVENNYIEIVESSGKGISGYGPNVIVRNNNITTVSGIGIFYQSYAPNFRVENNRITSESGVGISIKKVTINERPFDVVIINNKISTGADYIIDAADVEKDSNWKIEGNPGGNYLTPNGTYDGSRPTYKFNGTVHTVTPSNYETYIDANGLLKNIVKEGDILNFLGNFNDKEIKINTPIKITSSQKNAIFYNSTFRVSSSGVWIENLKIINKNANRANAWGILVYDVEEGCTIINNRIEVQDPNAAYSIYVVGSGMVDIINNTLSSSGNLLTYTLLAYSASDCRFINNTITTNGTGEKYGVEGEHCLDGQEVCLDGDQFCLDGSHIVKEIFRTYGILMIYSSSNDVSGNDVTVTSKLNSTYNNIGAGASTNTIIGIDLYYNSHNNVFSKNNVNVYGLDNYMYGMGVLGYYTGHNAPKGEGASNNQFISNDINIRGNYFATGIIVGDESEDTLVKNNKINLTSDGVVYGTTLELSHKSTVDNNEFALNSDIVYGLEAEISNNNVISNNKFDINAKKVYGMALSNSNNNEIYGNKLYANSTGETVNLELDSITGENCGIYLASLSTNNQIYDNNITSTKGYAINLDNEANSNTISDNYLISEFGNANKAINNTNNNQIIGNYIYFINGKLSDVTIQYLEYGNITFTAEDMDGANVDFYDDIGEYIGSATVQNGKATLEYRFSEETTPALYPISVIVSKEDYKITEFTSKLTVTEGNLNIEVTNISVKNGLKGRFTAKVTNALGKAVSGQTVKFYLIGILGSAVTDKNGIATAIFPVASQFSGIILIKAAITDSDNYLPNDGYGNLTILDIAPVNVNIDTKLSFNGILATLTDNNGLAIDNKKVSLKIGSNSYNVKTNSLGQITLPNVNVGTYSVSITFNGNPLYETKTVNTKISVLAPLSGNAGATVYYGSTVRYKVRVIGADGNYVGSGKIVSIKINGKNYNVKTNANGYAIYSVKLGVGKYTITAEYNGYKASNKITFKPTLTAKNIVKKKAKKIKFSVKLVNNKGNILKNKKITFKIKGKKYTAKTNKKGVATISIKNLKVGKFTITSSYGGCTIKNTIKIKK